MRWAASSKQYGVSFNLRPVFSLPASEVAPCLVLHVGGRNLSPCRSLSASHKKFGLGCNLFACVCLNSDWAPLQDLGPHSCRELHGRLFQLALTASHSCFAFRWPLTRCHVLLSPLRRTPSRFVNEPVSNRDKCFCGSIKKKV